MMLPENPFRDWNDKLESGRHVWSPEFRTERKLCRDVFAEGQQSLIDAGWRPVKSVEEIHRVVWAILCNSCDCENAPECPEGTDGCITYTIAQKLHDWWLKEINNAT